MGNISVTQYDNRLGLYLPMGGTKDNPAMLVPFYKIDRSELDHIVRSNLAEQGITDDATVDAVVDEAERLYEERRKVEESRKELHRLMEIKRQGGKLMSSGNRKWKQAFYPSKGGK